jgi:hypothetical protein
MLTHTYRGQWEKAAGELQGAFPAEQVTDPRLRERIEMLNTLFSEAGDAPRKSPNGAAWLSTAIPGAGQLYAGEPWDALNALLVNAGLVTLIYFAVRNQWYLEGVLVGLYPLRRYYLGNRENARLAAERRNRAVEEHYRQQLLEEIASLLEAQD